VRTVVEYIAERVASLPRHGVESRAGARVLERRGHQAAERRSAFSLRAQEQRRIHPTNALLVCIFIVAARHVLRLPAFG